MMAASRAAWNVKHTAHCQPKSDRPGICCQLPSVGTSSTIIFEMGRSGVASLSTEYKQDVSESSTKRLSAVVVPCQSFSC